MPICILHEYLLEKIKEICPNSRHPARQHHQNRQTRLWPPPTHAEYFLYRLLKLLDWATAKGVLPACHFHHNLKIFLLSNGQVVDHTIVMRVTYFIKWISLLAVTGTRWSVTQPLTILHLRQSCRPQKRNRLRIHEYDLI